MHSTKAHNPWRSALLLLITTLTFSCQGNELSRDKAAQLIRAETRYPKDLPYNEIPLRVNVSNAPEYAGRILLYTQQFESLRNEGVLTYQTDQSLEPGFTTFVGTLTDKGRQYAVATRPDPGTSADNILLTAKTGFLEFGEVTGIVERGELNIAEVSYTERVVDITPFGRLSGVAQETLNRTATFTKYDDGWRMNR